MALQKINKGKYMFKNCDKCCAVVNLIDKVRDILKDVFLLVIRLYWGWNFFLAGKGKFQNFDRTVGFFKSINIPMPEVNVVLAAGAETLGGLLLVVGLCSRLVPIPLIFTMIVAYLTAHSEELSKIFSETDKFLGASPFLYMYACIIIFLFGNGKFSLEYFLCKKCESSCKA